jgi:excinuclease ABC subunit B
MEFKLEAPYVPAGDQPQAISHLCSLLKMERSCCFIGVTGPEKHLPWLMRGTAATSTLVISHNKTLAAQLYGEFKSFFSDNAVEYFVSYYDYYQPDSLPAGNRCIHRKRFEH